MPGSNADDIVGDYFEAESWDALIDVDPEAEPELDPSPTPPSTD
jgi:hypothetical protein